MSTSFARGVGEPTLGRLRGADLVGLLQAVGALRNRAALAAMLGCSITGVLLSGLCSFLALYVGAFALLGGLCMLAGVLVGLNAAGLLLMDQAQGRDPRGLTEALLGGLACAVKVVVLGLGYLACVFVVALAIALLFALCKIPYLGPVLLFVVFPLSVLVVGITQFVLVVCVALALPALWEGETLGRAIAGALQIARSRAVECVVLLLGVALLTGAVAFFLFAILFSGLAVAGPLMGSMLGLGNVIGLDALLPGVGSIVMRGAGYAVALGIGTGLLFALVLSISALVYLLGLNLAYLRLTDDLELDAELSLGAQLGRTASRARELSRKARAAAARGGSAESFDPLHAPTEPVPWSPPTVGPAETTMPLIGKPSGACPHCLAPIAPSDAFCGHCGEPVR